MSLNLIKKWFIKRNLLSDKDNIGITKSTALDLDAYIQHRVDESISGIADGTQITYTSGTITNSVNTNALGTGTKSSNADSSTGQSVDSYAFANTVVAGNFVSNTGVYLLAGTNNTFPYNKQIFLTKPVILTESSATSFLQLPVPSYSLPGSIGGIVVYTVLAADGTNVQSKSGRVVYDAVISNGGTVTVTITDTQNTTAATSGTLTVTITAVASSSNIIFKANAVSSLTQTSLNIKFHLIGN